ncbi:tripartite tricarboxylate transporter TctB family protein [Pelagibacterium sp. 26DY04]|uniref:tripartite tricarboxylate transporter TctB family protein n=1 Tax=Pelagibacterium sp. 26DY04 TaxID=2967130 RepID=UPI0028158136|nr:tripartite tricarboxylate transporter TctB family protein [Pelagibacterium sp. 26DY04]WMT85479.1 tripartite tricarboxylate transporter TctB family protein [Pelagibacterium sp. 26DY04]
MSITRVDQLFAIFLVAFGCYIVWSGFDYGYMNGTTPGAGFFPVLIGSAIAVLSVVNLVRSLRGSEQLSGGLAKRDIVKIALLCAATALLIVATPYLGLTLSVIIFMLAAAFIIRPSLEPSFLVRLVPVAVLFPLLLRVAFGMWLRIPLPTGPFGL